jgi:hypothetical protein
LRNSVQISANKVDRQRIKLDTKAEEIIKEQLRVIKAAEKGIERLNSDLSALRFRLKTYTGKFPKSKDSGYYTMKQRYENKLQEREVLQNAKNIAEESISASRLHRIPGEFDRRGLI